MPLCANGLREWKRTGELSMGANGCDAYEKRSGTLGGGIDEFQPLLFHKISIILSRDRNWRGFVSLKGRIPVNIGARINEDYL